MEVPRLRHLRDALHTGNVDVAQAWAAMEADFDDDEEDVRSPAPIAIAAGHRFSEIMPPDPDGAFTPPFVGRRSRPSTRS